MTSRFGLSLASVFLTIGLGAQEKKTRAVDYQGDVQSINKGTSTIMVRTGNGIRNVMYSASTKFLYGHSADNKPGSLDQVKEGNYISCAGSLEKDHLMATQCVYREAR